MSFNGIIAQDFWLAFEPLRLHHHTSLSPISTSTSRSWPLRWWPFWSCTSPEKSPTRLSDNIFTFFAETCPKRLSLVFRNPGKCHARLRNHCWPSERSKKSLSTENFSRKKNWARVRFTFIHRKTTKKSHRVNFFSVSERKKNPAVLRSD